MGHAGYIYLMYADTGHYKIGMSVEPNERLRSFRTEMPVDVQPVHVFPTDDMRLAERALHYVFRGSRYRGEWFVLDDEDVMWVKSIYKFSTTTKSFEIRATEKREDDVKRLIQLLEDLSRIGSTAHDKEGNPILSLAELGLYFHYSLLQAKYGDDYLDGDDDEEEIDINDPIVSVHLKRCEIALSQGFREGLLQQAIYVGTGPNR